jgi:hypothetical protein
MAVEQAGPVADAIVADLARAREPDLTGFTPEQVRQALRAMFGPDGLRPDWLDWIRRGIADRSGHRVSLADADRSEFAWLSKEWGAGYQRLVGPGTDQLVLVGNTTPPFQFVPRNGKAPVPART